MLTMISLSYAQQKETPVTTIGSMTLKINMNQTTSIVTITMSGPSTKWFSVGLGATSMSTNKDCITYGTSLLDQHFTGGHVAPTTDAVNNYTLVSNDVSGSTRTVVMTRAFNTNDTFDFTFSYSMSSINIVWAVGPSTNVSSEHNNFGSKNLSFNTLGTEDYTVLDKINVYPNPSNGVFNISKNNLTTISKIRVFDINAKLLKEITNEFDNDNNTIDLSQLNKGMYFMEISNEFSQTVKKIIIN